MTELEKKAYAYAADRQQDPNFPVYNWETEISDAYEQGYKDAIDKVYKWLLNRYYDNGYLDLDDIDELKDKMEEQQ